MLPTHDARMALGEWSGAGGDRARGRFSFPATLPVFIGHFPGHPLVPGVYLLAAVAEIAARALGTSLEIRAVERAKWSAPAHPGERLEVAVEWRAQDGGWLLDGSVSGPTGVCASCRLAVIAGG